MVILPDLLPALGKRSHLVTNWMHLPFRFCHEVQLLNLRISSTSHFLSSHPQLPASPLVPLVPMGRYTMLFETPRPSRSPYVQQALPKYFARHIRSGPNTRGHCNGHSSLANSATPNKALISRNQQLHDSQTYLLVHMNGWAFA